jgi:ribosomal-protein-alanine N-acetyltransferase
MTDIHVYKPYYAPDQDRMEKIVDFLFKHLDQFGDPRRDIQEAIDFALKRKVSFGGFLLEAREDDTTVGAVVINQTGMKGYIPENILVYIAVHSDFRGKGIGKQLMEKAIEQAKGDIALHVEPDNPARKLYEKVGFDNKYLEMRYKKEKKENSPLEKAYNKTTVG